jgi:hypothetical protein
MPAALADRDHPHLRKRRSVLPGPGIAERRNVGLAGRSVPLKPIHGHQPPWPQPRTPGQGIGDRDCDLVEQPRDRLRTQPLTGLGDPTGARHLSPVIPASPPGQRLGQPGRDLLITPSRNTSSHAAAIDHPTATPAYPWPGPPHPPHPAAPTRPTPPSTPSPSAGPRPPHHQSASQAMIIPTPPLRAPQRHDPHQRSTYQDQTKLSGIACTTGDAAIRPRIILTPATP